MMLDKYVDITLGLASLWCVVLAVIIVHLLLG